jgi:hypothetical protein
MKTPKEFDCVRMKDEIGAVDTPVARLDGRRDPGAYPAKPCHVPDPDCQAVAQASGPRQETGEGGRRTPRGYTLETQPQSGVTRKRSRGGSGDPPRK